MGYGVAMHTRSYRHLTAGERETLSLALAYGHSLRVMARILGRAPSTLSREVARNTTCGYTYRACTAQSHATARAHHPHGFERYFNAHRPYKSLGGKTPAQLTQDWYHRVPKRFLRPPFGVFTT